MSLLFLLVVVHAVAAHLPACPEGKYRYEFTECDSAGGRWRVAVPRKPDECEVIGLESVRQKDCTSTCGPGQFLDVNSPDQNCKACPVGHYSLGGDVSYKNWTSIPSGFETQSFDNSYSEWSNNKKRGNCTNSEWKARGIHLVSGYDTCTSQLTLAVTLKKNGYVTFVYQSTNDEVMFNVYVRNEQCMMTTGEHSYLYPKRTKNFEWNNATVNLTPGHNLIVWEASLYPTNHERTQEPQSVLIKSIEVHGVAYTSECTPCPAGTYSNTEGAKRCTPCPADHFSSEGATECKQCATQTDYARPGSAKCSKRKPCKINDYIEIHSECDESNQYKKMFQWIEPKICRDDVDGATSLPVSGVKEKCPPCNPGMFKNGSTCDFCPPMTYNDGSSENCTKCPASTEPDYGFDFHWWRTWPSNFVRICDSAYKRGCASDGGFQLHGTYIDSGSGHADDARLLLFLKTDGFRTGTLSSGHGTITFEFEVDCAGSCYLKFNQFRFVNGKKRYEELKRWQGKQLKQKYSYAASSKNIKGFYWVFAKNLDVGRRYSTDEEDDHFKYRHDMVKIYSIKVTKTVGGGAAKCLDCPVGMKEEGCIPCPHGNRIVKDKNGKRSCDPCPANTYLNVTDPYGDKACVRCGPGLHSDKGSTECIASCHYTSKEGKSYNFKPVSGFHGVKTSALFTTKGTKYYHHFNISICQNDPNARASCYSNVSFSKSEADQTYNSSICRMTIIPRKGALPYAVQPMSVGEQLMGISTRKIAANDNILEGEGVENTTAVSFHYKANEITEACPEGRSTVIHLVCDPRHEEVKVDVPIKCPEGTCDGCSFHFIIHTSTACPLCTKDDYEKIVTGCVDRMKNITYMWKRPKVCEGGVELPPRNSTACSFLDRSLKDFAIGLAVFAGFVILMILAVLVLWFKNRRLEYKYHKLIQNASDRSGELPGAPQCVGDDDDEEEEVHFKGSGNAGRGKRFLKNIKDKFSGEGHVAEQYNFNNYSDDDTIDTIEPTAKTPLS